tara:strand:+ start:10527 stop:11003 length:477 start_codon:yes stop_codon:yes gene_type:complete
MKKYRIEIKWALIFVGMMLLWMLMERLLGFHDAHIDKHAIVTNLIAIPAIAIYVFALLDKRKNFYDGFMSYKQGFISGLIITLIVTLFTPLIQYITSTVITPDYFSNIIEYTVNEGMMEREDAEAYFNLKSYMIQATIGAPIMGLLTTAVVAFFTKKK